MLFNSALLMAAVNCFAVLAAPADSAALASAISTAVSIDISAPEFLFAPNGPGSLGTMEEAHAVLEQLTAASNAESGLQSRGPVGPTKGKKYIWGTWVFVAGLYVVEEFGGTSWKFPKDPVSVGYIAGQIASSMVATIGNGVASKNVGGGWTWKAQILQSNYEFNHIPYNLLYGVVYDAIVGASDWLTDDNAFDFMLHDNSAGKALLEIMVFPTIHSNIVRYHDEL